MNANQRTRLLQRGAALMALALVAAPWWSNTARGETSPIGTGSAWNDYPNTNQVPPPGGDGNGGPGGDFAPFPWFSCPNTPNPQTLPPCFCPPGYQGETSGGGTPPHLCPPPSGDGTPPYGKPQPPGSGKPPHNTPGSGTPPQNTPQLPGNGTPPYGKPQPPGSGKPPHNTPGSGTPPGGQQQTPPGCQWDKPQGGKPAGDNQTDVVIRWVGQIQSGGQTLRVEFQKKGNVWTESWNGVPLFQHQELSFTGGIAVLYDSNRQIYVQLNSNTASFNGPSGSAQASGGFRAIG
ncbi:MAG TPA: hypothetical protein VMM76_01150 [Pirellulaceae bacterium]|nr:hypothetical protein [Pirellulaceae bacterium]